MYISAADFQGTSSWPFLADCAAQSRKASLMDDFEDSCREK